MYTPQVRQAHARMAPRLPIGAFVQLLKPEAMGVATRAQFYAPVRFTVQLCGSIGSASSTVRVDVPVHANEERWLDDMKLRFAKMLGYKTTASELARMDFRTVAGKSIAGVPVDRLAVVGKLDFCVDGKRVRVPEMPAVPMEYSATKLPSIAKYVNDALESDMLHQRVAAALVNKSAQEINAALCPDGAVHRVIEEHLRTALPAGVKSWTEFVRSRHMNSPHELADKDAAATLSAISKTALVQFRAMVIAARVPIEQHLAAVESARIAQAMAARGQDATYHAPIIGASNDATRHSTTKVPSGVELFTKLTTDAFASPFLRQSLINTLYTRPIACSHCRWPEKKEENVPRAATKSGRGGSEPARGRGVAPTRSDEDSDLDLDLGGGGSAIPPSGSGGDGFFQRPPASGSYTGVSDFFAGRKLVDIDTLDASFRATLASTNVKDYLVLRSVFLDQQFDKTDADYSFGLTSNSAVGNFLYYFFGLNTFKPSASKKAVADCMPYLGQIIRDYGKNVGVALLYPLVRFVEHLRGSATMPELQQLFEDHLATFPGTAEAARKAARQQEAERNRMYADDGDKRRRNAEAADQAAREADAAEARARESARQANIARAEQEERERSAREQAKRQAELERRQAERDRKAQEEAAARNKKPTGAYVVRPADGGQVVNGMLQLRQYVTTRLGVRASTLDGIVSDPLNELQPIADTMRTTAEKEALVNYVLSVYGLESAGTFDNSETTWNAINEAIGEEVTTLLSSKGALRLRYDEDPSHTVFDLVADESDDATTKPAPMFVEPLVNAKDIAKTNELLDTLDEDQVRALTMIKDLLRTANLYNVYPRDIVGIEIRNGLKIAVNHNVLKIVLMALGEHWDGADWTGLNSRQTAALARRVLNAARAKRGLKPLTEVESAQVKAAIGAHHPWNALVHHTLQPVTGAYPAYYNVLHRTQDMSKDAPYPHDLDATYEAYHMFMGAPAPARLVEAPVDVKEVMRARLVPYVASKAPPVVPIACNGNYSPKAPAADSDDEEIGATIDGPRLVPYVPPAARAIGRSATDKAPPVVPIEGRHRGTSKCGTCGHRRCRCPKPRINAGMPSVDDFMAKYMANK